jgi:hypothetical protein
LNCSGLATKAQLADAFWPAVSPDQPTDRCPYFGWVADDTAMSWFYGDPNRTHLDNGCAARYGDLDNWQGGFESEFINQETTGAYCQECPLDLHECSPPTGPPPSMPPPNLPPPCGPDAPIDPTGVFKDDTASHGDFAAAGVAVSCAINTGPTSPYGQGHWQIFCTRDETTGVDLEFPRCVPIGDANGPNSALTTADEGAACSTEALDYYGCIAGCRANYYCCSSTGSSCIPVGETCPCPECADNYPGADPGCPGGDDDYLFLITSAGAGATTKCCRPTDAPESPPPLSPPPPTPPPFPPPAPPTLPSPEAVLLTTIHHLPRHLCGGSPIDPVTGNLIKYPYASAAEAIDACLSYNCTGLANLSFINSTDYWFANGHGADTGNSTAEVDMCLAAWYINDIGFDGSSEYVMAWYMHTSDRVGVGCGMAGYNKWRMGSAGAGCIGCPRYLDRCPSPPPFPPMPPPEHPPPQIPAPVSPPVSPEPSPPPFPPPAPSTPPNPPTTPVPPSTPSPPTHPASPAQPTTPDDPPPPTPPPPREPAYLQLLLLLVTLVAALLACCGCWSLAFPAAPAAPCPEAPDKRNTLAYRRWQEDCKNRKLVGRLPVRNALRLAVKTPARPETQSLLRAF